MAGQVDIQQTEVPTTMQARSEGVTDRTVSKQLNAVARVLSEEGANRNTAIILAYCCSAGGDASAGGKLYRAYQKHEHEPTGPLDTAAQRLLRNSAVFDADKHTPTTQQSWIAWAASHIRPSAVAAREPQVGPAVLEDEMEYARDGEWRSMAMEEDAAEQRKREEMQRGGEEVQQRRAEKAKRFIFGPNVEHTRRADRRRRLGGVYV